MSIPITCSEQWNYRYQHRIFIQLDEDTKQTERIRGPAFIAFGKSTVIRSITLTASVGELIFKGLGLAFSSSPEESQRGKDLLKRIPKQIGELTFGSLIMLIVEPFGIIRYPRNYIWENVEYIKVILPHAEADTIGSKEYKKDLYNAKLKC